ncbi:MAG: carbamate kinase [Acholeplasmatales bacterium]|nr:MAG: carbamate kinase [Acholeplasmatales bacterium]
MSRFVVSLGGNALGNTPEEQKTLLEHVVIPISALIASGHEVVLVHGNGPQVGMINLAFADSSTTPEMPFPECGAMSQGYIGYHLQNALDNRLRSIGLSRAVATVVTQVVVDAADPRFHQPSKPIGAFYDHETSLKLQDEKGYTMKEDSGRGYRRVVPSPLPVDVVEKAVIHSALKAGHIVICAGGGGIPVIEQNQRYVGVAAVIDKDFASAKIAELIDADTLVILTAVEHVCLHFNTPDEQLLRQVDAETMQRYLDAGHFGQGSMAPKVEACLKFVAQAGKTAVISSLEKAVEAFAFETGTLIKS